MRILSGHQSLFRNASQLSALQRSAVPAWSRCVARQVRYSVKAARYARTNARPGSFGRNGPAHFNKAEHESMYLYRAHSNTSYIFGCYAAGALMITAGIFNHSTIAWANEKGIEEKQPLPTFIPVFTFVGSLFIVGAGCYFIFAKSRNLCQSIRSLPATGSAGNRSLLLEIKRAQWLPFTQPAILRVPPGDVTLIGSMKADQRLRLVHTPLKEAGILAPIQLVQDAVRGLFRAITNSGFLKLQVHGYFYAWKIDSRLAWAFEDGEALESLINVTKTDKR